MKNNLDILLALVALVVVVYRLFQVEAAIYDAIEDLKESVSERINLLERSLALHCAIYAERKEQVDYLLRALEEKIDHKSGRLWDEIKELKLELRYKPKSGEG
ncbi:hypothetical protein OGM63_24760 [Plectonema radiosum NIES-515]|uniref:Uncharacterized protein n=1 Tax=Plectonema radiosum NIES-515 TaxID=2986073 RepID=A0ABT3B6W3_9CYAN|nr:hypothetical protein [Plectonema radiosum]MCV3216675.1 hypothetical protein [Plectonema radiosum NIES-515]